MFRSRPRTGSKRVESRLSNLQQRANLADGENAFNQSGDGGVSAACTRSYLVRREGKTGTDRGASQDECEAVGSLAT